MKNILKQFVGWDTSLRQSEFKTAAIKLTLWHSLAILVALAAASILVIVIFSYSELGTTIRTSPQVEHSEMSLYEMGEHLIAIILLFDLIALGFGVFFSYLDARRTLRPIEVMYKKQEQFMSDVAHELRTPLSVMKAGVETLLRQERDTETYVEYIKDQHEEINRMTSLVNDLLFLLKHKQVNEETKTQVNLGEIIRQQVKAFGPYASEHGVTITCVDKKDDEIINGIATALYKLVNNLLKNAIDYNVPGGQVIVSLDKKVSSLVLTVSDTGVGIADAQKDKIFDRFYRGDKARTLDNQTGSGLGLAIVKSIVEKHQGSIEVVSEKGEGTMVIVSFPVL